MTRIAYLVHNLADAAVARRVRMLQAAGAEVRLAGFCRDGDVPATVAGVETILLGRTHDAALAQRALRVGANMILPGKLRAALRGADAIIARNLEMLALANRGRRAAPGARLAYESLDIHRSLLGTGATNRALRALERALLQRCDLLISSSPAFVSEYFVRYQGLTVPAVLVENKLLRIGADAALPAQTAPLPRPPWQIGWFGNLRCRKTLDILTRAAERGNGAIRILIAGKASPAEFPNFASAVSRPHVTYHGPYASGVLPALYGQCHYAWAVDFFEEGLNSSWLLPNRLYEAASFGTVPIALASVETGRWLARRKAGLLLEAEQANNGLQPCLEGIDAAGYARLRQAVAAIPQADLIAGQNDCEALLEAVSG